MSFLLDTNVISELTKRAPHANLRAWFSGVASVDLFLSVITLGKIRKGIERRRATSAADAERLQAWLHALTLQYRPRILLFDEETADRWGRIMASYPERPCRGRAIGGDGAAAQPHFRDPEYPSRGDDRGTVRQPVRSCRATPGSLTSSKRPAVAGRARSTASEASMP